MTGRYGPYLTGVKPFGRTLLATTGSGVTMDS